MAVIENALLEQRIKACSDIANGTLPIEQAPQRGELSWCQEVQDVVDLKQTYDMLKAAHERMCRATGMQV